MESTLLLPSNGHYAAACASFWQSKSSFSVYYWVDDHTSIGKSINCFTMVIGQPLCLLQASEKQMTILQMSLELLLQSVGHMLVLHTSDIGNAAFCKQGFFLPCQSVCSVEAFHISWGCWFAQRLMWHWWCSSL